MTKGIDFPARIGYRNYVSKRDKLKLLARLKAARRLESTATQLGVTRQGLLRVLQGKSTSAPLLHALAAIADSLPAEKKRIA